MTQSEKIAQAYELVAQAISLVRADDITTILNDVTFEMITKVDRELYDLQRKCEECAEILRKNHAKSSVLT
jgi:hypothetical protein